MSLPIREMLLPRPPEAEEGRGVTCPFSRLKEIETDPALLPCAEALNRALARLEEPPRRILTEKINLGIAERMKIKLNLIDHINQSPASPPPLTYFIESRHLSRWQYSPPSCTTRLVQTEFDPPTIEDF